MAGGEVLLEVKDLVKHYKDVVAVDGVSFEVRAGTVFTLLGQNGAGKTTTLEMAQGIRTPTSGQVRIFGEDPRRASAALKRRMGVLPQAFSSFGTLTVRENLRYWADIYGVKPDMAALLDSLGLEEHADKRFKDLSGGTKRRVGIAAAIVNDPDLVFLDEPTAGVDPASRRQLWDIVLRLRSQGRSVVLTTHYMDEAERLSDHVAVVRKGRIVAEGTPERVKLQYGGTTTIRLTGLGGPLPEEILRRPGAVQTGAAATIPLADASEGPAIIAALVRSGVHYHELSIREPSLDDAFINIVAGLEQGA